MKNPIPFWWFLLFAIGLTWGSSFILIKKALIDFNPVQLAALRMLIAGAALLPMALRKIANIPGKYLLLLVLVGILGNGLPAYLFAKAQTHIESALAGMLNTLVPLFTLVLGAFFFSTPVKKHQSAGVFIGLLGALLLLWPDLSLQGDLAYSTLVLFASFCYALNLNIVRNYLGTISAVLITGIAFMYLIIPSAWVLMESDFLITMKESETAWRSLLFVSILAVFGTSLAVIGFNHLIKNAGSMFASSVTYIVPLFAIGWGWFDGEQLKWMQLLGIMVVLSGVYLVNKKQKPLTD